MEINKTANEVFTIAAEHGWHEKKNPMAQSLMLMVTELAEAMEEIRHDKPSLYVKDGKPEGIQSELADCVIRIMDTFVEEGWDMENALKLKIEYNRTRPFKHGGKKC